MRKPTASAITVLDAAARIVPDVASPWMGVLWLTALPLRFLQLYFVVQLTRLDEPSKYLYYFWNLAAWTFAAFVVSLYGRAVFVRACRIAQHDGASTGLEPFKVPLNDFLPYLYTSLLIEFFFYLSIVMFAWPLAIVFAGIAAAASQGIGGPKVFRAPMDILAIAGNWKPLLGSTLVFTLSLLFVFINLNVLVKLLLFLGAPLIGESLPRWEYIFAPMWENVPLPKHGIVTGLMSVATVLVVEPFWLAANVELVQIARSRRSGDDMRLWFKNLSASNAEVEG